MYGGSVISRHFLPIELNGMKWDAGMILFEFDALREPERTQFPKVGEYLRSLGMEFNEVSPQMLWCGHIHPDLYIANRLDAVPDGFDEDKFHATFIEPMAQKILGIPTTEICADYYRAAWLPRYWPQTIREKKSLDTRFWYPRSGYAGEVAERVGTRTPDAKPAFDVVRLSLAFVLAKPTRPFQVLFVADKSPIYRVTNMDACAGLNPEYQRFVIESREYCTDVSDEAQKLDLIKAVRYSSSKSVSMPIPSLANVRRGWKPAPNLNQQLLEVMSAVTQS